MANIRRIQLTADVSKFDAAKIGVENGGLVYPIAMNGNQYEPVAARAGPGRSGWSLATRNLNQIAQMLEDHPDATVGLRVPTPHGFDRYYALVGDAFVEIPAAVYRVGG
ncbi:hypothetical protein ACU8NU_00475 [Rhizobium leguminosarum]